MSSCSERGARPLLARDIRSIRVMLPGLMRLPMIALWLGALAACPAASGYSGECHADRDCSAGEVCARDQMCAPATSVRAVTTTWTIQGQPASAITCVSHPDLYISYLGSDAGDQLGFAPVPCHLGSFAMDKLPSRFRTVELGVEGGVFERRAIGSGNSVQIDLP